ncbi:MAG TPA: hypothetical protein VLT59_06220 [Steroidobacteraceae bacterium]|nr:hypothetical protein [Steroidobacteraceae bacterium]
MHRAARFATACCLALAAFGGATAQTLEMVETPSATVERPSRGMTMNRVESRFGAPARRIAAVGDPPITRWEYPGFIVFFEYDKVLHAVATR